MPRNDSPTDGIRMPRRGHARFVGGSLSGTRQADSEPAPFITSVRREVYECRSRDPDGTLVYVCTNPAPDIREIDRLNREISELHVSAVDTRSGTITVSGTPRSTPDRESPFLGVDRSVRSPYRIWNWQPLPDYKFVEATEVVLVTLIEGGIDKSRLSIRKVLGIRGYEVLVDGYPAAMMYARKCKDESLEIVTVWATHWSYMAPCGAILADMPSKPEVLNDVD